MRESAPNQTLDVFAPDLERATPENSAFARNCLIFRKLASISIKKRRIDFSTLGLRVQRKTAIIDVINMSTW